MSGQTETEQTTVVTDEDVPSRIRQIINAADKQVVLVSPYVDDWQRLTDWLTLAIRSGTRVLLITRRDTDRNGAFTYGGTKGSGVLARLADEGVEVRWTDSLHSKIYLNEDEVFVTSMNLLSSSAANSKEIGLSLIQGANVAAVREYVWQLRALSKAFESDSSSKVKTAAKPSPSKPVRYSKKVSQRPRAKRSEPKKRGGGFGGFLKDLILSAPGYCVRCGEGLTEAEVDSGKVMCAKDYGSWAKFKNPEFKENFCTTCGDEKTTSFGRPQCRECYADNPR